MILGIDPGLTGAGAVIGQTGNYISVFDMPTVLANKSSNRQMVNAAELARLIRQAMTDAQGDIIAVLEHVQAMPGRPTAPGEKSRSMGASSAFAFGQSYGIIQGVLAALGISCHGVTPQRWKKYFELGKDKDCSRELAQRMWPAAPLGLKKHHGRADAMLIARWYAETSDF